MDKNPFEILGIAKDILHKLNNEQIRALVKANYRTLQTFFHPDKQGGNQEKSRELNWAYQELEDEKKFLLYKKLYLEQKKKKTNRLEQELEYYRFIEAQYYTYLVKYLSSQANFSQGPTINNTPNLSLEMSETLLASQEEAYLINLPYSQENVFTSHFYLEVKKDGRIIKRYVRIIRKNKGQKQEKTTDIKEFTNKMLIGILPFRSIVNSSMIDSNHNILDLIHRAQSLDNIDTSLPILSGKVCKLANHMKNARISLAGFTLIMPRLTVDLIKEGFLFSINRVNDQVFFELEGKIIRISEK